MAVCWRTVTGGAGCGARAEPGSAVRRWLYCCLLSFCLIGRAERGDRLGCWFVTVVGDFREVVGHER